MTARTSIKNLTTGGLAALALCAGTVVGAPEAAAATASSCTAQPADRTPGDGGKQSITVHTTAGAGVTLQVHYKTTTHTFGPLAADKNGTATLVFSTGRPTRNYTVKVDVSTDSGQSCSTQFTPQ
jgi:hypothetical protein